MKKIILIILFSGIYYKLFSMDIFPYSSALKEASGADSYGYESVYYNPAGTLLKEISINITQSRLYYDTYCYDIGIIFNNFLIGFYQKIKKNTVIKQPVINQDGTYEIDPLTGKIKEEIIGFADKVYSRLNLGVSKNFFNNVTGGFLFFINQNQHGKFFEVYIGGNAGVIYKMNKKIKIGLSIINTGFSVLKDNFSNFEYEHLSFIYAISFDIDLFVLKAGISYNTYDANTDISCGIKKKILDSFFIFCGYNLEQFSSGFSWKIKNIILNYSFLINVDYYNTNRISIKYLF